MGLVLRGKVWLLMPMQSFDCGKAESAGGRCYLVFVCDVFRWNGGWLVAKMVGMTELDESIRY